MTKRKSVTKRQKERTKRSTNKKVLYVASNMRHINNFHTDYIKALDECGYEVKVMARGHGADYNIPFEKRIFSLKNVLCLKRIRRIIKNEAFDSIILNTSLASFLVRLACHIKSRPKTLNIVHGYLFSMGTNTPKDALLLFCEIFVKRKTDLIITMNKEDYRIAKKFKLSKKIIHSRGMGAVLRPVITERETVRSEYFDIGDFVMTFVGELSKRKNQLFLIDALKEIKKEISSAKLCLVGDGDELCALKKRTKELSLENDVIFVGERTDACDFIRDCDLYVSASTIEGLPFNIIEAMGAKKTILASKIKGHTDLITDGAEGFLFALDDLEDFVDKVCKIYRGDIKLSPQKIYEGYLRFEKQSVFPETLGIILSEIK